MVSVGRFGHQAANNESHGLVKSLIPGQAGALTAVSNDIDFTELVRACQVCRVLPLVYFDRPICHCDSQHETLVLWRKPDVLG